MFDWMFILFGLTLHNFNGRVEEEEVYSAAPFALVPGWVDKAPTGDLDNIILANMHQLDYSSDDSTSLWRFLEEYYPPDDDRCNSILLLPGIPQSYTFRPVPLPPSPNENYILVEHPSSTASNDIQVVINSSYMSRHLKYRQFVVLDVACRK
ncbi:UNVERIFIED_CONTAM: hypothetical protein Slati_2121600 [Sesamum latifolium]|uniref:Uncharacterized protein n=1 Tax=Sesamum latifolium TaxID=2727402 RepID=A0AAW2WPS0_9LAMI